MIRRIVYIFSAIVLFYWSVSLPLPVRAATSNSLTGYAWSSNVGWISFSCSNTSSCGSVNYGVSVDDTGNLTGYAWSSNVGWIQFGGLSGFPSGSGTQPKNAVTDGTNIKGWARAISMSSGSGSYDGWIALSGATSDSHSYGVDLNGTKLSGYAWGSSVLGWINFDVADTAGAPSGCTNLCYVGLSAPFQLPGFNIVGSGNLQIQFLGDSGADSQSGTYFIDNGGTSYANPVTVTVSGISPSIPSGVTATYSFNGGAFSSNPSVVVSSPYTSGFSFRVHMSGSVSSQYTVTLLGTGSDNTTATLPIIITPVSSNPSFQEH